MPNTAAISLSRFRHTVSRRFSHSHSEGQLFLINKGLAQLWTSSGKLALRDTWMGWIPPGIDHEVASSGLIAGTSFRISQDIAWAFPKGPVAGPTGDLVLMLWRRLFEDSDVVRQARLLQVIADEMAAVEVCGMGHCSAPVAELIAALNADPASRVTLAEWATILGTTERTLARRLRQETGKSFIEWRTELRVTKARGLLSSGASVTEASLAVGYDNPSAFARSFHRLTGRLPGSFRNAC